MILVVGGIGSGKRAYVRSLGFEDGDIVPAVRLESATWQCVVEAAQDLVRDEGADPEAVAALLVETTGVVMCDDVGSGIVPIDKGEREWRDRAGALSRSLAEKADVVVRMICGIPTAIKGSLPGGARSESPLSLADRPVRLVIMRHGMTTANERREYAGSIDVLLTDAGISEALAAGVCPQFARVFTSPMKRARHTASLCFPNAFQYVFDGLREMNFGVFEGRSANDMEDDEAYREWVDSMCTLPCPGGESRAILEERTAEALTNVVKVARAHGDEYAIVVAHGGTIMAALDSLAETEREYFEWQVGNCEGYVADATLADGRLRLANVERFHDLSFLGTADEAGADGGAGTDGKAGADNAPDASNASNAVIVSGNDPRFSPHSFFQNRACKYFPCHEGVDPRDFNCLYCYCPLYALGPDCGGDFTYTDKGRKNCTGCALPHIRDNGGDLVARHFSKIADLASRNEADTNPRPS